MLPINCGSHVDYQNFVVTNLRKYYPNPDSLAKSTWDIIERFWNLDLSETDTLLASKYSKFGPAPRTPSCMQRSYLLSIDFKVTRFQIFIGLVHSTVLDLNKWKHTFFQLESCFHTHEIIHIVSQCFWVNEVSFPEHRVANRICVTR